MDRSRRTTLVLDSRVEDLERLHAGVGAFFAGIGRENQTAAFAVCAEELVINTILHGFGGEPGHAVELELSASGGRVQCRISDDGPAFDPTVDVTADLDSDIEDREVGGLGRHLVSTMMDEFSYARERGRNVVTFARTVGDDHDDRH